MTTATATQSKGMSPSTLALIVAFLAVGVLAFYSFQDRSGESETTAVSPIQTMTQEDLAERTALYEKANEAAQQFPEWPQSKEDLIEEFWAGIQSGDIAKAVIYCPGSKESDFQPYLQFPPAAAVQAIGNPHPHPDFPEVELTPVSIPFPGFPDKVIRMAFLTTDDGRIAVDGRYTIWW